MYVTRGQCDASYLPSRKASPPIGWYQIILLGDRGTCVLTTFPGLHSTVGWLGFEPATCWLQVQHQPLCHRATQFAGMETTVVGFLWRCKKITWDSCRTEDSCYCNETEWECCYCCAFGGKKEPAGQWQREIRHQVQYSIIISDICSPNVDCHLY